MLQFPCSEPIASIASLDSTSPFPGMTSMGGIDICIEFRAWIVKEGGSLVSKISSKISHNWNRLRLTDDGHDRECSSTDEDTPESDTVGLPHGKGGGSNNFGVTLGKLPTKVMLLAVNLPMSGAIVCSDKPSGITAAAVTFRKKFLVRPLAKIALKMANPMQPPKFLMVRTRPDVMAIGSVGAENCAAVTKVTKHIPRPKP
jgi:hypothetical protein